MRKISISAIIIHLLLLSVQGAGSAAFDLLLHPYSAVSAGRGGAVSLADGPGAIFDNPVATASVENYSISFSFSPYIYSTSYGALGVTIPREENRYSMGLLYRSVGSVDGLDEFGDSLGRSFSPYSAALLFSWGRPLPDGLSVGAGTIFAYDRLSSDFYTSSGAVDGVYASALLFNASMRWDQRSYSLSAGIKNAGFFLSRYGKDDSSSLPLSLYAGFMGELRHEFTTRWYLETDYQIPWGVFIRPSIEIPFPQYLVLRIGTSFSLDDISHAWDALGGETFDNGDYSKSHIEKLSIGASISTPLANGRMDVDVAYRFTVDNLPNILLLSLAYSF